MQTECNEASSPYLVILVKKMQFKSIHSFIERELVILSYCPYVIKWSATGLMQELAAKLQ